MAYIGRDTDKISNVEVLDNITFDGSSSYTLQKNSVNFTPSSANTLLVSIDGVVQAGNFTVSGSTIDFGTAVAGTSTCDFILHYGVGLITAPSDGTVTTAKLGDSAVTTAKLNDASVSLAKLTATGTKDATTFLRGDNTFDTPPLGGITGADQWRITADHTGVGDVTANWERADSDGFNYIGTGMSESSGIFTFPETGIWSIQFISMPYVTGADTAYILSTIDTTVDNSTYGTASRSYVSLYEASAYSNANCYFIFDVTNTTTHKCKFKLGQNQAGTPIFQGSSAHNSTFATFIRLGDT